jgi:hypothetical protein
MCVELVMCYTTHLVVSHLKQFCYYSSLVLIAFWYL